MSPPPHLGHTKFRATQQSVTPSEPRIESADEVLRRYESYRNDPWLFLSECVFTEDPTDSANPIKLYPSHFAYLYLVVQLWLANLFLAIPKSRRMTVSWTFIALMLWDVIFHKGRRWACVSKKEDDSAELVRRAEFIFNHIPPEKIPRELLPKLKNDRMSIAPPVLDFPELRSSIQGYPQGADQLRQHGFSGIFGDECAFWDQAQAFYSGSRPTIQGGGRMVLVSSRAPGFFKKIVFDQIDSPDYNFPELAPTRIEKPMEGVDVWRNPKNGFTVCELHYSANPAKRGQLFRETIRKSMPLRDFMMEYEKSWETFEGLPVFGDFNPQFHIARDPLRPDVGLPLLIGWDFGLTPACVVAQLEGSRLSIFREYVAENMGVRRFSPQVMSDLKLKYPQHMMREDFHYTFIDPAGLGRKDTDERTCAQELHDAGFRNIRSGAMLWEPRRKAVEEFLIGLDSDGAHLQIQEETCPVLTSGFKGGYRYPESFAEIEPSKGLPLKDKHSHPHDALQYIATGVSSLRNSLGPVFEIATNSYGFQQPDNSTKVKQYGRTINE